MVLMSGLSFSHAWNCWSIWRSVCMVRFEDLVLLWSR